MNWKRFFTASLAIFVVGSAWGYVVDNFILRSEYESLRNLWRSDITSKMWVTYTISLLISLMFTYIFIKGREGRGILEGVRFGIVIWLFAVVPWHHFVWVMFPIPYSLIIKWTLYDLVTVLVAGILVAVIYKPTQVAKA